MGFYFSVCALHAHFIVNLVHIIAKSVVTNV